MLTSESHVGRLSLSLVFSWFVSFTCRWSTRQRKSRHVHRRRCALPHFRSREEPGVRSHRVSQVPPDDCVEQLLGSPLASLKNAVLLQDSVACFSLVPKCVACFSLMMPCIWFEGGSCSSEVARPALASNTGGEYKVEHPKEVDYRPSLLANSMPVARATWALRAEFTSSAESHLPAKLTSP